MARLGPFVTPQSFERQRSVTLDAAISPPAQIVWTNAAGNVSITTPDGTTKVYTLPASFGLPVAATVITTSGTTISASDLILLDL